MNELLPSRLHPDAEALNAFAEGALPIHERCQMLSHLARCADCREVVFLAQDAARQAAPVTTQADSTWQRWMGQLNSVPVFGLGIGVAALAGAALIFITLHTRPASAPAIALHAPQAMPTPLQAPAPAAKSSAHPISREPKPLPLPKLVPPPKMPLVEPPRPGMPTIAGGMSYSMGTGVGRAPVKGMAARAQPMGFLASHGDAIPQTNAQQYVTRSNNAQAGQLMVAPAKPAPVTLGAAAPTPLPAALPQAAAKDSLAFDGAPRSASESVAVDSAASALSTDSASFASTLPLEARAKQRSMRSSSLTRSELPSKLPAASMVSRGTRTLAADTAGTLFLSLDAGQHWTAVAPQWQGNVTQLRLAPAPSAASSAPPPTPDFQLTTTSGAVWFSTDGLHWQAAP